MVGQSFFVIKKTDLPRIEYNKIDQEEVKKYSLELILDEYNVYASVIDLNSSEKLRKELEASNDNKDLMKSVLLNILILVEVRWKKDISNVMLTTYSKFRERGIPNELKDIKPIE